MTLLQALPQKKWFWPLLLILMWAGAICFINPEGEFALNDDWAYARNVHELSEHNRFYVDDWPAMTLVSQTLYGTLVAKIFGFCFTHLRISMLVLAVCSSVTLFFLLKRLSKNDFASFLLTAGFCFGQLFCLLSFTFMTDVFFLSFIIFSMHALTCYLDNGKTKHYALYIFFCVMAVLCRQQGILLPLLIVPALLLKESKITFRLAVHALFPFTIAFVLSRGYIKILEYFDIPHNIQGIANLFRNLPERTLHSFYLTTGDYLLVAGWMLLPCTLLLLLRRKGISFNVKKLIVLLVIAAALVFATKEALGTFPLGNVFSSEGIGPKVVKEGPQHITPGRLVLPEPLLLFMRYAALSSVILIVFFMAAPGEKKYMAVQKTERGILRGACIFASGYFVFSMLNEVYFDRYVLPLGLFLLLISVPFMPQFNPVAKLVLMLTTLALYVFSLLLIKDYFSWNRARYEGIAWLNKQGINAHLIHGGFEFLGWNKPGKGSKENWYWIDKEDFVVTHHRIPGYSVKKYYSYRHYIPYTTDTVFVLEAAGKKCFSPERMDEKLLEYEKLVKDKPELLQSAKEKAAAKNISLDSSMRMDARWLLMQLECWDTIPAAKTGNR